MNETTGGLSAVPAETETSIPVKASPGKVGKYNFPATSGDTKLTSSILQQMEELYQKKLQEGRGLISGLKDAAALSMAARPGGSSAYLQQRETEKANRAADLFNIRSQIAQYQAAQEAQKRFDAQSADILGLPRSGQEAPAAGAPASARSPMFDFTEEEKNLLLNLRNNPTKFNETLNKIILEKSKAIASPEARKSVYTVQMFDEQGNVRMYDVDLPTKLRLEREGRVIDISRPETTIFKKPNAPGNVPRITPAPAAAPQAPAAAPAVTGPAEAFPVPAPTKPQERKTSSSNLFQDVDPTILSSIERYLETKGGGTELGEPLSYPVEQQARAMPKFEPVASAAPMFKTATDAITPMSAAVSEELPEPLEKPVAEVPEMEPIKTAQVSRIPSISEMKRQKELETFKEQERVKTLQEEEKGFNTSTDEKKAARRIAVSGEIMDIVRKDPQIVGYFQEPGVASAFGKLVRDGISTPFGQFGMRQVEEALFAAVPGQTKAAMEKRDRLRTLFEETAFQLSTLIKGQGQVTEFERILLQQVAGSISNAPGNVIKIHQGLQELAKVDQQLGRAYRKSGLPYADFIRTDGYQKIMDGYVQRLEDIRRAPVESFNAPAASGQTKSGVKWKRVPQ